MTNIVYLFYYKQLTNKTMKKIQTKTSLLAFTFFSLLFLSCQKDQNSFSPNPSFESSKITTDANTETHTSSIRMNGTNYYSFYWNPQGSVMKAVVTITSPILPGVNSNQASLDYVQRVGKPDDEVGYVIGKQLGGNGSAGFIYPQSAFFDKWGLRFFESKILKTLASEGSVYIVATLNYEPLPSLSQRPLSITYDVSGGKGSTYSYTFDNNP